MSSADLADLARFVGVAHPPPVELADVVTRAYDIALYAEAISDTNPLWHDDAYARSWGLPGVVAPPGFVETRSPSYANYHLMPSADALDRVLPFPYPFPEADRPRTVLLSETVRPDRPVTPGDAFAATSTVTDVGVRSGGRAGDLVTVTYEKDYATASGERLARVEWMVGALRNPVEVRRAEGDRSDVARHSDVAQRSTLDTVTGPAVLGGLTQTVDLGLMTKWGAVVWDIGLPHVDADYVRRFYGWERPLVHGPLMAALHRRAVTDWLTPHDAIATHTTRFTSPVLSGEDLYTELVLESVAVGDGVTTAALTSRMWDEHGTTVSLGTATCTLRDA